jgi:hypothetical protein
MQSFRMTLCLYAAIVFAIVVRTTLISSGSTVPVMTLVIIRTIYIIYKIKSFLPSVTDDTITENVGETKRGMMQSRRNIPSSP